VRHRCGLTGSIARLAGGSGHLSSGSVRRKGSRAGLTHRDFTPRQGMCQLDRLPQTFIAWLYRLEEAKHAFRAAGRPHGKESVIRVP
jgi:hypothetical protein